jgi:hypothetical protein
MERKPVWYIHVFNMPAQMTERLFYCIAYTPHNKNGVVAVGQGSSMILWIFTSLRAGVLIWYIS